MATAVSSISGEARSRMRLPITLSNSHFITTSESVMGLSSMAYVGTWPT
jgi:hypothetical protein